jgi:hypothetical protein
VISPSKQPEESLGAEAREMRHDDGGGEDGFQRGENGSRRYERCRIHVRINGH